MQQTIKQRHSLWQRITILCVSLSIFIFATSVISIFSSTPAQAATSNQLNFQGRLLTSSGDLVPDGNYHVEFKLYNDTASAGTPDQGACTYGGGTPDAECLWTETRSTGNLVSIQNGYYSVYLGDVTALPNIDWSQDLYLGMNIGGSGGGASWDGEMTPRFKLTAVPYAFRSSNVASSSTNAASSDSDNISITSGNALGATSNSGNISVDTGTATVTGTTGTISLGSANASALNLGRSGLTTVNVGNFTVQGGSATLGTAGQAGSLVVSDGSSNTATLQVNALAGNYTYSIPTTTGNDTFCLVTLANCTGGGGSSLFTDAGTFTYLTASTDDFVIGDTTVAGSSLFVDESAGSTTFGNTSLAGSLIVSDGSSNTGTLLTAALGSDRTYTLPDESGTFCLTSGNCAGVGGTGDILNNGQNGTVRIGSNDANSTILESNGTDRLTISSTGASTFSGTLAVTTLGSTDNASFLCRNSSNILAGCNYVPLSGSLTDNVADAFDLQEGTNNYFNINTTDSLENISFGNSTTNPSYFFLGSGTLSVDGAVVVGDGLTVIGNSSFSGKISTYYTTTDDADFGNETVLEVADPVSPGQYYGVGSFLSIVSDSNTADYSLTEFTSVLGIANNMTPALTIPNMVGVSGQVIVNGDVSTVTTNGVALLAKNSFDALGAITNGYGLYVENQTSATNDYGIYVAGADTYALFVDSGATRLDGTLEVQGGATLGTSGTVGSLGISDGSSNTGTVLLQATSGNYNYTIPTTTANDTFCLVGLNNCAGTGVTTIGAIDGQTKSANGAVISGSSIYMQTADVSSVGLVSIGSQTFNGVKTFDDGAVVTTGGFTISAGALAVNSDSITSDGATLVINASGAVDIQDNVTVDNLTVDSGATITAGALAVNGDSITSDGATLVINAAGTVDVQDALTADTVTSQGALTVSAGGASVTGGINNNSGGITNGGAVSGVTTLGLSGAITGATATNTINGLIINSGALSGVTTINASGLVTSVGLTAGAGLIQGTGGLTVTGNTSLSTTAGNTVTVGNATGLLALTGSAGNIFNFAGVTITDAELNRLDGKDANLLDVNDAVATAITGTGALNAGSITSGFGAIDIGADTITSGLINGQTISSTANFTGTLAVNGASLTIGTTSTTNGTIVLNNSTNAFTTTITAPNTTGSSKTITLPNETGTVCTTGSVCSGYQASGSYATTSLNNITATNLGAALNTTSGDLALTTTTSGNITATTAGTAGLFNVLTGNLKVGAGTPTVALNGDDAYITGTLEVDGTSNFAGALTVTTGGIAVTGNSTITGTLSGLTGLTVASGGASISGGINNNSGGITNGGAVSGVTTLGLSGAITGATATNTINGLIINSGALSGVTTISLSGAISGGTTFTGSGNINTTAGAFQLNGTDINTAGTLTNVAYENQANTFTAANIFQSDVDFTLNGTENIAVTSDLAGGVQVISVIATPSASVGATRGLFVQQADSANSNGLDIALVVDNADANLAIGTALQISNTGGGGYTTLLDTDSLDISGAGAISGATGLASTGTIAFSGAGNFSVDSSAFDVTTGGAVSGVTTLGASTSVTTPTLTSTAALAVTGGTTLTLSSTGAGNDIIINGADILDVQDNATFAGTLGVTGNASFGTAGVAGSLIVSDGSSSTITIKTATQVAATNYDVTVPAITANDTFCLATASNCSAIGSAGGALTGSYPNPTLANVSTAGSITFVSGSSGILQQDNASLYFDDSNNRLGVGTNTTTGNRLTVNNNAVAENIFVAQDNGTDVFTIADGGTVSARSINPISNDTYDLGTDALRWRDIYLGGDTLHIGTSTADEGALSYATASNILTLQSTGTISLASSTSLTSGSTLTVTAGATSLTGATSGVALTVSNSTSTGNILTLNDNASAVFTVADGGEFTSTNNDTTASVINLASTGDFAIQDAGTAAFWVQDDAITRVGSAGTLSIVDGNGDLYVQDELEVDGATTVGGTISVTGAANFDGNLTLGNATSDTITFTGRVNSDILPSADDTYDLGSSSLRWRDLYLGPTSLHVYCSAAECTSNRDWSLGVIETNGATEGNLNLGLAGANNLVISTAGNVGLGTAEPGSKLELNIGSDLRPSGTPATASMLRMQGGQSANIWGQRWDMNVSGVTVNNSRLSFSGGNNSSGSYVTSEVMTLHSTGVLGIGTTETTGFSNNTLVAGKLNVRNTMSSLSALVYAGSLFENRITVADANTERRATLLIDTSVDISSGTLQNVQGLLVNTRNGQNTAGATVTYQIGIYTRNDTSTGSTTSNSYGIQVATSAGTGTITNGYGILIDDVRGTNDYAIWQTGTDDSSVFNGTVDVGFQGAVTVNGVCHSGTDLDVATTTTRTLVACSAAPNDYAEFYPAEVGVEAGDIVATTPNMLTYEAQGADAETGIVYSLGQKQISIIKKASAGDSALGIISTAPYQTIGKDIPTSANRKPLALSGRVPVKVNNEGGAISAGDKITLSSVPGVGRKATANSYTVGTALQSFSGTSGVIYVMVSNSYYAPPVSSVLQGASLDVSGNSVLNGDVQMNASLNVSGPTTVSTLTVTGNTTIQQNLVVLGNTTVQSLTVNGKIITTGATPTATLGASTTVGQSGAVTITGNDTAGSVSYTSGVVNLPTYNIATGAQLTTSFVSPFTVAPRIALTPKDSTSASVRYYVETTSTGFTIHFIDAPTASTTYTFDYIVIQ